MVGAPLKGRVVIIDDVLTSGTAIRQAIEILQAHPEAQLVGIVQLVDRQERGTGTRSTVQEVEEEFGVPVEAVLRMEDIMAYMEKQGMSEQLARMREHQKEYGIRKD
jgi:orotate phosphoribosyltransferase